MKVKRILHKAFYLFGALFLSLLFVFQTAIIPAKADENAVVYTDVLEDLQKDETFDVEQYPAVADDYSLQVIQIAESVNNELFVYVYQPSAGVKDLTATTIRLSVPVVGLDSTWNDYDLTLLNTNGVFQKYKVEGVTVSDEPIRYYDITAIHRTFDETIDNPANTNVEQTINEVVFEVAQLWTLQTHESGNITYTMKTTEVIHITAKVVGFIRYPDGYSLAPTACDSHFIAFNTDRKIDDLLEADVSYSSQDFTQVTAIGIGTQKTAGDLIEKQIAYVEKEQVGSNKGDGLWGNKYEWKRIQKVSSITEADKETLNLTTGTVEDMQTLTWIVRFIDTEYVSSPLANNYKKWTEISKVTILRLKFITDGKTFNLGVVDNKVTGSKDPLGVADTQLDDFMEKMDKWWEQILFILAIVVVGIAIVFVVSIIWPILWPCIVAGVKWLIGAIATLFTWVFKGLWFLLSLPFVLIGKLFKRKDKYDDEDYKE